MVTETGTDELKRRLDRLERLHRVGLALGSERDRDRLVERILIEAKELCDADGGTVYLRTEDDQLRFAIVRTNSLKLAIGGTTGNPIHFEPVPMFEPGSGEPNHANVASHCAHLKRSVNVEDAYHELGFDFSGTKAFDAANNYRSQSFLTIPMCNQEDRVIGVLQLINAQSNDHDRIVPFDEERQRIVEALASQAAVALDNQMLLHAQKQLMESFIKLIAEAIDHKSPYTGGHCRRVPLLTEMLTQAVCETREGEYADFSLSEDEWYELHIASWLHDCGKITTPVHVMDKGTKLESLCDRIGEIEARFQVLERDAEIAYLKECQRPGADDATLRADFEKTVADLEDARRFIASCNAGGEFMSQEKKARIRELATKTFRARNGDSKPLLTEDEVANLTISKGTLTESERLVINGHMVQTIRMLEALPFPRYLRRVPEYAGGHHERMDGSGYPRGIYAGDMSVPARVMAIADVFEALTAQDRPYKPGKTLSETMRIMGFMKKENHLDPVLFDIFVKSGVYRRYAKEHLPESSIDEVDEQALFDIQPEPYELPTAAERGTKHHGFRAEYEALVIKSDEP